MCVESPFLEGTLFYIISLNNEVCVESPFLEGTLFILSHGIISCVLKVHFLKGPYLYYLME